jgi:hypothetical protein
VAASIDTVKGLYYINWDLKASESDAGKYHAPVKTLVEVIPAVSITETSKIALTLADTTPPQISIGASSLP